MIILFKIKKYIFIEEEITSVYFNGFQSTLSPIDTLKLIKILFFYTFLNYKDVN